jgi:NADH-quinone oxidoreductase subunit C
MSESAVSPAAVAQAVRSNWPDVTQKSLQGNRLELVVPPSRIRDVVSLLNELISDAFPESVFGIDLQNDRYELIYVFWSHTSRILCQLRVSLEGAAPEVDSVCDIFPGLEWHERETHEMFGIGFKGHPDLRLLLLPEELGGKYPLRKSFKTDRSRLSETGLPEARPGSKEAEA